MELAAWASGQAVEVMTIDNGRRELVVWSSRLIVGVKEIDEQHMKLVEIINGFNDAMYSGTGWDMLGKALAALEEYAIYHFHTEERLMAEHKHEGFEAHKHGHELFRATIKRLKHKFDSGQIETAVEVLFFLREWLITHIMKADRELSQALNRLAAAR